MRIMGGKFSERKKNENKQIRPLPQAVVGGLEIRVIIDGVMRE